MIQLILTVLIADVITQTMKLFTHKYKTGKLNMHMLFSDGGMPSGHSVTVSALTTGIFFETGPSPLFVVAFFFSLIVLRDATGVRRAAGRQAEVLNVLIGKHHLQRKKLKELIGHTPWQVFWGVIIGIILCTISYTIY